MDELISEDIRRQTLLSGSEKTTWQPQRFTESSKSLFLSSSPPGGVDLPSSHPRESQKVGDGRLGPAPELHLHCIMGAGGV